MRQHGAYKDDLDKHHGALTDAQRAAQEHRGAADGARRHAGGLPECVPDAFMLVGTPCSMDLHVSILATCSVLNRVVSYYRATRVAHQIAIRLLTSATTDNKIQSCTAMYHTR